MYNKHQKNQKALRRKDEGEAHQSSVQGNELNIASYQLDSLSGSEKLMEEICEKENLIQALNKVKQNKGSPGVDGMTVDNLEPYLKKNWQRIKEQLLKGEYKPLPVKRVEIPKPGKGVRKLGIPSVIDRFIQQAILQPLQKQIDPTFSDHSFGFRPSKSAHQAVAQAQSYIKEGYRFVVDIDLEQFFDRVNHDKLMSEMAKRISDKRILKIIRNYLKAGILQNGVLILSEEGTVQGGPLSPLLSNVILDLLDKELEKRGHRFCRFADDCNTYVKSKRAGDRVMKSLEIFINKRLKLKVNQEKSAVEKAYKRKFLGFSFTSAKSPKRRISPEPERRFKTKIRELTRAGKGNSMEQITTRLKEYLTGWLGYYGFCETESVLRKLESWMHRRIRCAYWKQWKTGPNRAKQLRKLGVGKQLARQTAGTNKGSWHTSMSPALSYAFPKAYFSKEFGLPNFC